MQDFETANCKLNISKLKQCEEDSGGHIVTTATCRRVQRPLLYKCPPSVSTLDELCGELRRAFESEYVNVEYVTQLMQNYKSDYKQWKKYAKFDRYRYTRNLVDAGNGAFNIMILCWGPGHVSAIHDHADSHCFMKILHGSLEEVRYEWPNDCKADIIKHNNTIKCKTRRNSHDDIKSDDDVTNPDSGCQSDDSSAGVCDVTDDRAMVETGRSRLHTNQVCYINDSLGLHRVENPSVVDGAVSLHLYCPPFDACRVFDARTGQSNKVKVTFWSVYGKKRSKLDDSPLTTQQQEMKEN